MQKLKRFIAGKLVVLILIAGFSLTVDSCKDDDDKIDCGTFPDQVEEVYEAIDQAEVDENCKGVEDGYNKLIKLAKRGKNCDAMDEWIHSYGLTTLDELIDTLETQRDVVLGLMGC